MRIKLTLISHWGAAPKHKHVSGVCNPQFPALQSGKPLNLMRMGLLQKRPGYVTIAASIRLLLLRRGYFQFHPDFEAFR